MNRISQISPWRMLVFFAVLGASIAASASAASACGGFFCQNDPVDQTGERIVFTVNDDETITTLIEIQYQGEAEDFSWILPIPEAIDADALAVPDDGDAVFDELHQLTDVRFLAPEMPGCANDVLATADFASDSAEEGVELFATGEVGPFGFDVVGSEDPDALIDWLRDSNYQVTDAMVPLMDHYVDQQMAFVAMRLLDGETSDSIAPIEITYGGTEPMIPLVLTAVAAQPNMPIWVWVFGDGRAVSTNYSNMEVATEELTFFAFGGNNYTQLVQDRANALDGLAFITEFAGPADSLDLVHPWLLDQAGEQPYLTRLSTYIDPEEMTLDPVFGFDGSLPDVSNVRDATELEGLYACERNGEGGFFGFFGGGGDAIDPRNGTAEVVAFTPGAEQVQDQGDAETTSTPRESPERDASSGSGSDLVVWLVAFVAVGLSAALVFSRRQRSDP